MPQSLKSPSRPALAQSSEQRDERRSFFRGAAALISLTILVYLPVIIYGGYVWDDDVFLGLARTMRSGAGLARIWFDVGATLQYYPLTFTSFWIEQHLWGGSAFGHHLVNALLHAANAVILWRVLRRLNVPAAWLIAAVFAVHPVHVESVAWVSERKNVLSGFFYLLAADVYLAAVGKMTASPNTRVPRGAYVLVFVLFLCAMLAKTVTVTLPAALILALWTQRRLNWRTAWPLVPMFVVGIAMGALTALLERREVGAMGAEFAFTIVDRILIAGRALWFYAWKLLWPVNLSFVYPQWKIDPHAGWQWSFPVAAVAVILALRLGCKRLGRGPLVAILFFAGTLVPALGFVNVYPMQYSFVADHFQYLASIGVIALVVATLVKLARNASVTRAAAVALLIVLGYLTARAEMRFTGMNALWGDTVAKNPDAWMVHTNIGHMYATERRFDEARAAYLKARELSPRTAYTSHNIGYVLSKQGKLDDAKRAYEAALKLNPRLSLSMIGMGNVLRKENQLDAATSWFRRAIAYAPDSAAAHFSLASVMQQRGQIDDAIAEYRAAIAAEDADADAQFNLANLLLARKQLPEAIDHYERAIYIDPENAAIHANLGAALLLSGRTDDARREFLEALRIDPKLPQARRGLEMIEAGS